MKSQSSFSGRLTSFGIRRCSRDTRFAASVLIAAGLTLTATASAQNASPLTTSSTDNASEYFSLRLQAGQKFANVFSKTVSYEGGGVDGSAETIGGTALYEVVDPSPDRPELNNSSHYDGRAARQSLVQIRDDGRTVCSLKTGKCRPYLDDSGPVYDAFLWGKPKGMLAPGISWETRLETPWELGPAGMQTVTVLRMDPANHVITLKREGSGDGFFLGDQKQMTVKRNGKEYTVDVTPGTTHWVGITVFCNGLTMSDELLETRSLTVSSKDFGSASLTERQFTLLNQAVGDLL